MFKVNPFPSSLIMGRRDVPARQLPLCSAEFRNHHFWIDLVRHKAKLRRPWCEFVLALPLTFERGRLVAIARNSVRHVVEGGGGGPVPAMTAHPWRHRRVPLNSIMNWTHSWQLTMERVHLLPSRWRMGTLKCLNPSESWLCGKPVLPICLFEFSCFFSHFCKRNYFDLQ